MATILDPRLLDEDSRLTEDMATLHPTAIMAVPRILNRIYGAIQAKVQGNFFKRMIYNIAHAKKLELLKEGIYTKDTIWDKLVFSAVQVKTTFLKTILKNLKN
ncbi:unnamed protein product [Strongylus vulgaris]|uniref:Uncharacterized protein n=1 Tax=Strongylus vulgaris TaxID=40348 RepID=A0A3P7M2M3_STRVU|nr:unnamed protein product [Strongylus vulgaris]